MAATRKLHQEIERTLKKCNEGIDSLDALWMKLDHAVTSYEESQDDTNETGHHVSRGGLHGVGAELKEKKEKFEGELKKELKKVQRFRDQIRTWQGSDMKIDAGLQTQMEKMRKTIESHMERFKEQERKSKTKPFSTGALQAKLKRDKNDPKYKTLTWINNAMQKLQEFGELVEAEIESLSGSKSKASQRTELDEKKLFFDNHVEKLEMVMRLIDNDHVEPDVVDDSLKETIEYFIEEYSDAEEFDPYLLDEEIYEDLPLDLLKTELLVQVSSKSSGGTDDTGGAKEENEAGPATSSSSRRDREKDKEKDGGLDRKDSDKEKKSSHDKEKTSSEKSKSPTHGDESSSQRSHTKSEASNRSSNDAQHRSGATAAHPPAAEPSRDVVSTENAWTSSNKAIIKNLATPSQPVPAPAPAPAAVQTPLASVSVAPQVPAGATQDPPTAIGDRQLKDQFATGMQVPIQRGQPPLPPQPPPPAQTAARSQGDQLQRNQKATMALLSSAMRNIPAVDELDVRQSLDIGVRVKYKSWPPTQHPVPSVQVPESFPGAPIGESQLAEIMGKSIDVCFFCFYYMKGSIAQYLAAKELKRRGWRYHTSLSTWFQRYREPITLTDSYEESDMIFFDFYVTPGGSGNGGWCQRLKKNFVFQYQYLEDVLN